MFDPFPYGYKESHPQMNPRDAETHFHVQTKNVAKMATARASHSLVTLNSFMFSIGGQSNPKYTLRLVDRYSPKQDLWETVALLPDPRSHIATVVYQEKIYVIGGKDQNGNTIESIIYFDPETLTWGSKVNIELDRCDMPALIL